MPAPGERCSVDAEEQPTHRAGVPAPLPARFDLAAVQLLSDGGIGLSPRPQTNNDRPHRPGMRQAVRRRYPAAGRRDRPGNRPEIADGHFEDFLDPGTAPAPALEGWDMEPIKGGGDLLGRFAALLQLPNEGGDGAGALV